MKSILSFLLVVSSFWSFSAHAITFKELKLNQVLKASDPAQKDVSCEITVEALAPKEISLAVQLIRPGSTENFKAKFVKAAQIQSSGMMYLGETAFVAVKDETFEDGYIIRSQYVLSRPWWTKRMNLRLEKLFFGAHEHGTEETPIDCKNFQ